MRRRLQVALAKAHMVKPVLLAQARPGLSSPPSSEASSEGDGLGGLLPVTPSAAWRIDWTALTDAAAADAAAAVQPAQMLAASIRRATRGAAVLLVKNASGTLVGCKPQ